MSGFFEPRTLDSLVNVHRWGTPDARYGPPQVEIVEGGAAFDLAYETNRFLGRNDLAICAIGSATMTTGEAANRDGSGLEYVFLLTIVYQQRLAPNGSDDENGGEG